MSCHANVLLLLKRTLLNQKVTMSAYLITKKDSEVLDVEIFAAGENEGEEIVMVFTDEKNAQQYIDDAGWSADHTIAALDSIALLEWLIQCHRNGVELMATDPRRADQDAGRKLNALSIEAHLKQAGDHIVLVANPDF